MKGLVLGVYTESNKDAKDIKSTTKAYSDIDGKCGGKLSSFIERTGPFCKSVSSKIIWTPTLKDGSTLDFDCIAVMDLGAKDPKVNAMEDRDDKSENIRCSIADGINVLRSTSNFDEIHLDCCDTPLCVGESAALSIWCYDELKAESSRKSKPKLQLYQYAEISKDSLASYDKGILLGESQNFARHLQEIPSNYLTPISFCEKVEEKMKNIKNLELKIRDRAWAQSKKMGSFLSVAAGSHNEPQFLELHYQGAPGNEKCIALVGKGITFDTGGVSLKPSANMDKMRADMGGAACVVSAIYAVSSLGLKINVKGFIPLTDNVIDAKATRPGDVVTAMNGKTIQVDNTDAEGRLVLCDALCYAQEFKPAAILDFATLTGAVRVALGSSCSAVYSNDDKLWELMHQAGSMSGDRVWRMPLFKHYTKMMTKCALADINNIGTGRAGGSCTAAAFLMEFIEPGVKWLHGDIAGVVEKEDYNAPYLVKGFTGRPTRTIIHFLESAVENFP